jgi:uncharacterized membrane protein (UPF0182 family)
MSVFIYILAILGGLLLLLALIILGAVVTPSIVTTFKVVPYKIQKFVELEKDYIDKKVALKKSKKEKNLITEDANDEIL